MIANVLSIHLTPHVKVKCRRVGFPYAFHSQTLRRNQQTEAGLKVDFYACTASQAINVIIAVKVLTAGIKVSFVIELVASR